MEAIKWYFAPCPAKQSEAGRGAFYFFLHIEICSRGLQVACFKMTMGSPNIKTFWHNVLHDITG